MARGVCAALASAGVLVTLAGCATTQDEAARLQLNSARIRTAEQKTVVRSAGSAVAVSTVSLLSSPGAHTFVVTVHNRQSSAVMDLPISVGVSSRGDRRVDVNAHSTQELSYYDAHLPRIAAGGSLTWVFTTTAKLPSRAHPFALVGARPSPATSAGASAPTIAARVTATQHTRGGAVLEVGAAQQLDGPAVPDAHLRSRGARRPVRGRRRADRPPSRQSEDAFCPCPRQRPSVRCAAHRRRASRHRPLVLMRRQS